MAAAAGCRSKLYPLGGLRIPEKAGQRYADYHGEFPGHRLRTFCIFYRALKQILFMLCLMDYSFLASIASVCLITVSTSIKKPSAKTRLPKKAIVPAIL